MAVGINNERSETHEGLVLGAISTAFASIALIYSFADVSGAHFNPAVTFATVVAGKVSVRKGLLYVGIQLIAATAATVWLYAVSPANRSLSPVEQVIVTLHGDASVGHAFMMDILVYVIFATAFDQVDTSNTQTVTLPDGTIKDSTIGRHLTIYTTNANTKAGFAPFAIGFTLGFLCFLGGSVSGGAFNPARVFGPSLVSGNWEWHWMYWLADFLGGAAAGVVQKFFAHKAIANAGQTVGTIKSGAEAGAASDARR
ncbi:MAG: aquaporin-like protein [Olpidium bornovanus]|uniref:Aquaporin-like protein n=1 Tax=Olpidium bornovanus TaxID=278681 RepID=A0A8H8DIL3_9FUNG|nr:MAG: aquaporin-like protein [Olpidium bornovanus]